MNKSISFTRTYRPSRRFQFCPCLMPVKFCKLTGLRGTMETQRKEERKGGSYSLERSKMMMKNRIVVQRLTVRRRGRYRAVRMKQKIGKKWLKVIRYFQHKSRRSIVGQEMKVLITFVFFLSYTEEIFIMIATGNCSLR